MIDISITKAREDGETRKPVVINRKPRKPLPWPKKALWNSSYKYHWWSIGKLFRNANGRKEKYTTRYQTDLYD